MKKELLFFVLCAFIAVTPAVLAENYPPILDERVCVEALDNSINCGQFIRFESFEGHSFIVLRENNKEVYWNISLILRIW